MAHRADGMNDIFENNVLIRGTLTANSLIANNSNLLPVGTILMWSSLSVPSGFLLCNGAEYPKTQYPALFAVIGTTYGGSSTTFILPNLSNKFVRGSTSVVGNIGGSDTHQHTMNDGTNTGTGYASVSDQGHQHALSNTVSFDSGSAYNTTTNAATDTGYAIVSDSGHTHPNGGSTNDQDTKPPYMDMLMIIKY